jgi:hypothetical protein
MIKSEISYAMRDAGFNHVAGMSWGKLTGRKIVYARAIEVAPSYWQIQWPKNEGDSE